MLRPFVLVVLLNFALLPGQEPQNAIPRNDNALRNAISGLNKSPSQLAPRMLQLVQPAAKTCSAPLRAMPIQNTEEFATQRVPTQNVVPMPRVAVPAPPCETAAR